MTVSSLVFLSVSAKLAESSSTTVTLLLSLLASMPAVATACGLNHRTGQPGMQLPNRARLLEPTCFDPSDRKGFRSSSATRLCLYKTSSVAWKGTRTSMTCCWRRCCGSVRYSVTSATVRGATTCLDRRQRGDTFWHLAYILAVKSWRTAELSRTPKVRRDRAD